MKIYPVNTLRTYKPLIQNKVWINLNNNEGRILPERIIKHGEKIWLV